MNIIKTEIEGVLIIEPRLFRDARGYFFESFSEREFEEKVAPILGHSVHFCQDNESMSSYGVMRGLHFQRPPYTQSKLVRCVKGRVLDVAVDIRKGSPTYGKHVAVELTEDNHRQFFIPKGFAHGFAVLSETAVFQYKCNNFYHPEADGSISILDDSLGIDWKIPTEHANLSEKDTKHALFKDFDSPFDTHQLILSNIFDMFTTDNNIYIGGTNVLLEWGKVPTDKSDLSEDKLKEIRSTVIERIQKMFRDYLELDNVSFLFGTGSSIHLGAASIQNIPLSVEDEIVENKDVDISNDFKIYVQKLQANKIACMNKGDIVTDANGWTYSFDGDYYRNCDVNEKDVDGKKQKVVDEYGEIDVPLETLLNYLIANLYVTEAEQDEEKVKRLQKMIAAIKKAMFNLCDVHLRTTKDSDLKRINNKGYEDIFKKDKYIFHEKFLKSLLQRPLNLKRANIFTSNYDLAFEYAFDNIGVKYIDGFSGFHHRYFKPETFDYDIFYPGSTTSGKVQRIEKVVRYFKLHGSITWVKDYDLNVSNVYGIKELPIDLIKANGDDASFNYGDLMIYPSAVKKSYTLDLPYSELIRQFSCAISQPQSVLFAVGYSFCDEHFNDIIYQALSNPSFTLIIVNFQKSEKSEEIKRLRDLKDPRIIILEGNDLGDFLTFSTELMPNFADASSSEEVTKTLESLLKKE